MQTDLNQQNDYPTWIATVNFNQQGLIPAIAQDFTTNKVLMMAWMNRESLLATARSGQAVYFSRSRQKLWHKGEESGHIQKIHAIKIDCDADVILLMVEQIGGIACHTGRESCFYRKLINNEWQIQEPVIKDPEEIYSHNLSKK